MKKKVPAKPRTKRVSATVPEVVVETGSWAKPLRLDRAQVFVGTCSWADTHFVKQGGFYPKPVAEKPAPRLRYYATVFPTVEIDATYYALLDPEMADRWVEWTPEGFVFHVKAFGLFTGHGIDPRRLPTEIQRLLPREAAGLRQVSFREIPREVEDASWEHFTEFTRRLRAADRLGYVLFQFPRWYVPSPGLFRRLKHIRGLLDGYRVAVEFRHRAWVDAKNHAAVTDVLRENDFIYVIPDEPELFWTVPPEIIITSDWSVVRFHGRNAAAWGRRGTSTHEVYDYLYSPAELKPWAARAREMTAQVKRLYLMFNNHYRGNSAKNGRMMQEMLATLTARSESSR